MNFEPLLDAAYPGPVLVPTEAEVAATWDQVGPPVLLVDLDLTHVDSAHVDARAELTLGVGEAVNAVAVTFRADLGSAVVHELDPWRWATSSWAVSVWVLPDTVCVPAGEALEVRYTRRVPGAADGLTTHPGRARTGPPTPRIVPAG